MSKKKTHDEFLESVKDNITKNHIEIVGKYISSQLPIRVRCSICGYQWDSYPSNIKRSGCPKCYHKLQSKRKTKTNKQFVDELKVISPNIIPLEEYTGCFDKIMVKCSDCGRVWSVTPQSLCMGNNCRYCSSKKLHDSFKSSTDEFIQKLNTLHNGKISLVGEYYNSKTKTMFKCNQCGNTWRTSPEVLIMGCGCPKCNRSLMEIDTEQYLRDRNIDYIPQKRFSDLRGDSRKLSYDFFIPSKNILIELQGQQHYMSVDYFGAEEAYKKRVRYDNLKREYAENNGMNLIEIKYSDKNKIPQILDEYLLAGDENGKYSVSRYN